MRDKGFTLVEILFSVIIATSIMWAVTSFGKNILSLNRSTSQSLTAGLESRQAMKVMIRELRGLTNLGSVGTSTITFVLNNKNVTYFLDVPNHMIKREVDGVQNILVSDLVSTTTPIFDYYDSNYAGTSTPLTPPVSLSIISLIRVTLMVDKDPNRSPPALITTSQVNLRNLKSNL